MIIMNCSVHPFKILSTTISSNLIFCSMMVFLLAPNSGIYQLAFESMPEQWAELKSCFQKLQQLEFRDLLNQIFYAAHIILLTIELFWFVHSTDDNLLSKDYFLVLTKYHDTFFVAGSKTVAFLNIVMNLRTARTKINNFRLMIVIYHYV